MADKPFIRLRAKRLSEETGPRVQLTAYQTTPRFRNPDKDARDRFYSEVRVLRLELPDFEFGEHYESFFDGLDPGEATEVHRGPGRWHNERKLIWEDTDVSVGKVYAYWVTAGSHPPAGPVAVKVRDPEVWWSCERIEAEMNLLAERFPQRVQKSVCGKSTEHRPIPVLCVGRPGPLVAVVGAVHAGESGPELMLWALGQLLAHEPELFDRAGVAIMPSANPDMRERLCDGVPEYLRPNPNMVDLNRNFPCNWNQVHLGYGLDSSDPDSMTYRGHRPASENETRAILAFLDRFRPAALLSCHCLAGICGEQWLVPLAAAEEADYLRRCEAVAKPYLQAMLPDWPKDRPWLAPGTTPGSLPHFCYRRLGIPAFDLEAPFDVEDRNQAKRDLTDRDLLDGYRQKHLRGLRALLNAL